MDELLLVVIKAPNTHPKIKAPRRFYNDEPELVYCVSYKCLRAFI